VTRSPARPSSRPSRDVIGGIRAITFDFGNTLVRVSREGLRAVTERTAVEASAALGLGDAAAFRVAWAEERDRQFREEVPAFREVDLHQRAVRILARLRGMPPPAPHERWDDGTAAGFAEPAEVGQTLQFQLRDPATSRQELRRLLGQDRLHPAAAVRSLRPPASVRPRRNYDLGRCRSRSA